MRIKIIFLQFFWEKVGEYVHSITRIIKSRLILSLWSYEHRLWLFNLYWLQKGKQTVIKVYHFYIWSGEQQN